MKIKSLPPYRSLRRAYRAMFFARRRIDELKKRQCVLVDRAPEPEPEKGAYVYRRGLPPWLGGALFLVMAIGVLAGLATIAPSGLTLSEHRDNFLNRLAAAQAFGRQVGHWYKERLPDGTFTLARYMGSVDQLPDKHELGDEWRTPDHLWIWMIPTGQTVASWVDP